MVNISVLQNAEISLQLNNTGITLRIEKFRRMLRLLSYEEIERYEQAVIEVKNEKRAIQSIA